VGGTPRSECCSQVRGRGLERLEWPLSGGLALHLREEAVSPSGMKARG
jgi:hypothetical protein